MMEDLIEDYFNWKSSSMITINVSNWKPKIDAYLKNKLALKKAVTEHNSKVESNYTFMQKLNGCTGKKEHIDYHDEIRPLEILKKTLDKASFLDVPLHLNFHWAKILCEIKSAENVSENVDYQI